MFNYLSVCNPVVCREMWDKSMEGMMGLVQKSTPSGYTYLAEWSGSSLINKVLDSYQSTQLHVEIIKKGRGAVSQS